MTSEPVPADRSPLPEPESSPPAPSLFLPPVDDPEILRVLAIGLPPAINIFVHRLHQANIVTS